MQRAKQAKEKQNLSQNNILTWLNLIKNEPHRLGHLLGYEKLTPLHSTWIKDCWDTSGSKGLMAFRGSYKTTSVIITGAIRYWLFKPSTRIILVRKTHEEACKVVKAISRAFDKPELQVLFKMIHGIAPIKDEDTKSHLLFNFKQTTTIEPSILAKGIYDAATGAHADVILHDDTIGLKDKTSRAEREKTKESTREYAGNILDPGALDIYLGTKWANGDAWDVIEEFAEVKKYPESKYNDFIPKEEIEKKKKRLTPFLQAINYELELIADDSLLFQNPNYGLFNDETWKNKKVVAHLDAAYDGDNTCALTISDGKYAIGWIHEGHVQDFYNFVAKQYKYWHCTEIFVEKNADKGYAAKDLTEIGLNCISYHESMNKEIKISTYLYKSWDNIIWDERTDPRYMNQIIDWKPGTTANDDAPDSAASLCREAFDTEEEELNDELQEQMAARRRRNNG